jgi:hypothetical protein
MSEQQKSPFARLDTSLLRSTATPQSADTTSQSKTEKQGNTETSFQGNKETGKQGNVETRKQVSKETSKRVLYPKVTYQLDPQVTDILEDTKRTLRRAYGLKVSLAEIVEEGIRLICNDVSQNKETSKLVNKFSGKHENKET